MDSKINVVLQEVDGETVVVVVEPQPEEPQPKEPENIRKLYVASLGYATTTAILKSHFQQYGDIVDSVVLKNKQTGESRGFGFVTYVRLKNIQIFFRGALCYKSLTSEICALWKASRKLKLIPEQEKQL